MSVNEKLYRSRHIWNDYQPCLGRVSTDYRRLCRPSIDRLSTECRPLYRPLCQPISRSTLPTVNKIQDPFRYHFDGLGYVYFADVVGSQPGQVKVALMKCHEGSTGPGGSLTVVRNAAPILRPKAVISVGACSGLNPDKTKLGDVVVSAKLTTYASKVVTSDQEQWAGISGYVSRRFLNIITNCAAGWQPPLKSPEDRYINVHSNGEFLSGPEQIRAEWRRKELLDRHPLAKGVEMEGEGESMSLLKAPQA